MNTCDGGEDYHGKIQHYGPACPLCAAWKTIRKLQNEMNALEDALSANGFYYDSNNNLTLSTD